MNALGLMVVLAGPALAAAWLISEFRWPRWSRILLGCLAMVVLTAIAFLATLIVTRMDYNQSYGFATKDLVDQIITGIEANRTELVLGELKRFQAEYHPTYENRARYVPLAEQATVRMKQGSPQQAAGADTAGRGSAQP